MSADGWRTPYNTYPGSDTATLTRIAAGESDLRHTTVADPQTAEQVLPTLALCGTASHVETVVRAVRRRHTRPEDTAARRSPRR